MNSQNLSARLNNLNVRLATAKGIKTRIDQQCSDIKKKIDEEVEDVRTKKDAHLLLLAFIAHRREAAIKAIEKTGTYALRAVYNDERKLVFLKNEEKKTTAAFKMEVGIESILNGDRMVTGLDDERGGGVAETASFALRFAALEWLGYDGPLILDEAFKSMSSDEKIHDLAKFLGKYFKASGRQGIFATHKADVFQEYADHCVFVTQSDGISKTSS